MPSGPFTKQMGWRTPKVNNYVGDAVIGGQITGLPSGLKFGQGQSTLPGDRMILNAVDALAWADSTIATSVYGGLFVYVATKSNSVLTPTLGHLAFWDSSVADALCQVTPDESGSQGVALSAGVFLSTMTKGNYWWIQVAGKVDVVFTAAFTGVPSNGCPVYASADGLGTFDVLDGGGNPSFTQVGQMLQRYKGDALALPVAGSHGVIDISMCPILRW